MPTTLGVGDFIRIVIKHRWLILVAFFVTVVGVTVVTYTMTPVYEAEAVLLVKLGRAYTHRPEVEERQTKEIRDSVAVINAELQILRSHDLAEQVLQRFDPLELFPGLAEQAGKAESSGGSPVLKFKRRLGAKGLAQSDLIKVSFEHKDPELAARVVNEVVAVFKEKHLEAFADPRTAAFLRAKVESYASALHEAETRLQTFREEHPSSGEHLGERWSQVDEALRDTRNELAGQSQRLEFLREELAKQHALPGVIAAGANGAAQKAKERLLELRLAESNLALRFQDSHPDLIDVRSQIELVEDFLAAEEMLPTPTETQSALETQILSTEAEIRYHEARQIVLKQELLRIDEELRDSVRHEEQRRMLERERNLREANFTTYQERLEEASISDEMDRQKIANISVLQRAVVPSKPKSPKKRVNLAGGAVLGVALGFGLAFTKEFIIEPALWKPWLLSDVDVDEALGRINGDRPPSPS